MADAGTAGTRSTGTANTDAWNPGQYERFAGERSHPLFDLAAMVQALDGGRAIDLGCGTGALTAQLRALVGAGEVLGLDSSAAMLADAAAHEGERVRFVEGDLATFHEAGAWDLVFSNAALQWAPDHGRVLARWTESLRPYGQLAVQVPTNADHASHLVAAAVAHQEPFLSALGGTPPPDAVADNVLRPEHYAELLDRLGFVEQHVRLQVYGHHLATTADVVEWVKGTSLTRFQRQMAPDVYEQFVRRYRERLVGELGEQAPYFYAFKRILLWGRLA
jgi:trans-aconitate 2-methyltransferase